MKEVKLNTKDYELIMEKVRIEFNNMSLRWGNRTSLCECYVEAVLEYTKNNKLIIKEGKIFKDG